jgi:hypothetical protein
MPGKSRAFFVFREVIKSTKTLSCNDPLVQVLILLLIFLIRFMELP